MAGLVVAGLRRRSLGLHEAAGDLRVTGDDVGRNASVPVLGRSFRRRLGDHSTGLEAGAAATDELTGLQGFPLLGAGRGGDEEGDEGDDDEGEGLGGHGELRIGGDGVGDRVAVGLIWIH